MGMADSNHRRKDARSLGSPSNRASAAPGAFKMTIASDFAESRDVQKTLLDEIAKRGFNGHAIFAIKLALEEAMINAIKHGNKLNPHKKVHIEASLSPRQAEIIIEDEGPGFERSAVPDPTAEENLERCSGRGILLIETYMNEVEWTRGGRRLRMLKRNEADVLPRS